MSQNTVTASVERLMGNVGKASKDIAASGPALIAAVKPTLEMMTGGVMRIGGQIGTSEGIVAAFKQVLTDHGIREADKIALEQMAVLEVGLMKIADPTFDITGVGIAPAEHN